MALINNPTFKNILVAIALGALAVLGFAPYYIFPASIISVAGIAYLWLKAGTPKAAWLLGCSYGLGMYCIGIYWIYICLHTFGGMPWWFAGFATLCLCAFMAIFVGLVGYLSKKFSMPWLSVPILWGLSDWVRSWIFTGFPWLTLGYSQVPHSPLAGFMPVVGVYGVSVLTALIACLLTAIFVYVWQKSEPIKVRNAITAITLLLVSGLILKAIEWTKPIGKPISVALIQGNVGQAEKWSPDTALNTMNTYFDMVNQSKAQLIITPETALPVQRSQIGYGIATVITHTKQNNSDVIFGMVDVVETEGEQIQYYNSAVSFGTSPTQVYSKNHLVPFGEFIPLKQVFGWIYRDWLNMPLSDLSRGGQEQASMRLAGQRVGVNICYEDVFGEEIIRQLPEATMLVNISNDAWYGQSFAAHQHMQFSQARALETGRFMLRATNTGATAAIDQHGYVFAHAPHDVQTTLDVQAQGYSGATPYVRFGNWPFIVFCFGVIIAIILKQKNRIKTLEKK
jgi:apolipoprotein N-acyltransferase